MFAIVMDRKKIILLISLCLFVTALIYRVTHPYKQKRVAELTYSRDKVRIPMAKISQQNTKLTPTKNYIKFKLFTDSSPRSREISNNIFFDEKVTPMNEKQAIKAETKLKMPEKVVAPIVDKRSQVKEDLSRFKSFGYLESDREIFLFLEKGKRVLIIRKGDKIDGKYIVKDITKEKLTLKPESINEDVHIDLGRLK